MQLFDAWDAMLEHLRLVDATGLGGSVLGVVCRNALTGRAVVDTRVLAAQVDTGRVLTLDALFLELNA